MNQSDRNSSNILLDELDQEIIALLRLDGRMAFKEIAKRLDIPEATARYRVQRLLQSGGIQITAWPNPAKLGVPHVLILYLTIKEGQTDAVAKQLTSMSQARFVAVTSGRCNIVADIYFGTHEDLLSFFSKLDQIKGILSYDSQIILKLLKAEYKYSLG
ncbi:MAG: Lrp/AsnC family transcriptional regulator [Chroococcus sp. CMT-3BRIN-NPC107]|jgi:Lrp/AsnC family transcriptional regulator for asnA, asnC and gidA|nr:Lrp/AsnC family transcriptional regulator [Chroococcus sp. CMT-3BRIN-NPC107]